MLKQSRHKRCNSQSKDAQQNQDEMSSAASKRSVLSSLSPAFAVTVLCCSLSNRTEDRQYPRIANIPNPPTISSNERTSWRVPLLYSTQYLLAGLSHNKLNVTIVRNIVLLIQRSQYREKSKVFQ